MKNWKNCNQVGAKHQRASAIVSTLDQEQTANPYRAIELAQPATRSVILVGGEITKRQAFPHA